MGTLAESMVSEATGPAAKLVAAHQKDEPITFYSGWFCPFVHRTWITLEEKGIPYKYVEVNPYKKEASFLALNPKGLVPTLGAPQPDGSQKPIIESNIINEYLEEAYPNQTPLWPKDPFQRAYMRVWIDHISSRIVPANQRVMTYHDQSDYTLDEARAQLVGALKAWIDAADPEGPFFLGPSLSYADIALAPFVARFFVIDHIGRGLDIPAPGKGGDDAATWDRWHRWKAAVMTRKSVLDTTSDPDAFLALMKKYIASRVETDLEKSQAKAKV